MSAVAVPLARTDVALHHVRRALDELAQVADQDAVFDAELGLLQALSALLKMHLEVAA